MKLQYLILVFLTLIFVTDSKEQDTITTLQPSATLDTNNPICAGSTLLVPFYSSGTFGNTNIYYAELSDSAGNFTTYDTVGPLISNQAYPASAGTPGAVLGGIPTNTPSGCHYYIRVVSDAPALAGIPWGPFCIQHCSINGPSGGSGNSGNPVLIHACVKSCYKDPGGYDYNLSYSLNSSSSVTFSPGNKFKVELLNTQTLAPIDTSLFGSVTSTTAGTITLHVPCSDTLCNLNLLKPSAGGPNYFIRLIATNATPPDSNLGPLMYLQIGYPNDSLVIQPDSANVYCENATPLFFASPNNSCTSDWTSPVNSYTWYVDNVLIPNITSSEVGFPYPAGTYTIMAKEDNNGCYSPLDTLIFKIGGLPSVNITGPALTCLGDTAIFTVPFANNTIYQWSTSNSSHAHIVDTANNLLEVKFDLASSYTVYITAINSCGVSSSSRRITVDTLCFTGDDLLKDVTSYLSVYPNPSRGNFTVTINQLHVENIKITNVLGQVLCNEITDNTLITNTRQINLQGKSKGIYFLQITCQEGIINKKVVVE